MDRINRLFNADIASFKASGLRKRYPRPLLLRRALIYHTQRLKYNSSPRVQSALDSILLLDLAESSVSLYTDVRRHAQSASESACKVIIGSRPLIIPPLLEAYEKALKNNDHRRMKGAMYSLLYGNLGKTAGRNWRFAPSLIRSFVGSSTADKPSIQKLAAGALYHVMDFGRPLPRMVIIDEHLLQTIAPQEDLVARIAEKRERIINKRNDIESKKAELALELVEIARSSHWKTATRAVTLVINLAMRFATVSPASFLELATVGTVDSHPGLRGLYSSALVAVSFPILHRTLAHINKQPVVLCYRNPCYLRSRI